MTALLIGYARVSTDAQDLTAQREGLLALEVDPGRLYIDHGLTGTNRERPGLREALAACRDGDTLVVTKLDRLALRTLKRAHEQWVRDRLEETSDSHTVVRPLSDGRAVWALLDGALSMSVESLDEGTPEVDEALADLSDAFLQLLNDYLDVIPDIHIQGMSAIRQAQRTLGAQLGELLEHGLVVLGGRRTLAVGGEPRPDAVFVITLASSLSNEPPDEAEDTAGVSDQPVT